MKDLFEAKTISAQKAEATDSKTVSIFLESKLYHVSGKWSWPLQTESIFCSDVMFALGEQLRQAATQCLIHPEDIQLVKNLLDQSFQDVPVDVHFRVITSHGAVVSIH